MPCGKQNLTRRKCTGFTLFEMVVVICAIVILYMVAVQKLNQLPAAAERVSFFSILEQIKLAVNLEMYTRLANGDTGSVQALTGTNPMDLMLEPPVNYRGEIPVVDDRTVERRGNWYFETSTGELVYVVGGSSIEDVWITFGNIDVNYGQIRFQLENVYRDEILASQRPVEQGEAGRLETNQGKWQAILVQPVRSFRWVQREELPLDIEQVVR